MSILNDKVNFIDWKGGLKFLVFDNSVPGICVLVLRSPFLRKMNFSRILAWPRKFKNPDFFSRKFIKKTEIMAYITVVAIPLAFAGSLYFTRNYWTKFISEGIAKFVSS